MGLELELEPVEPVGVVAAAAAAVEVAAWAGQSLMLGLNDGQREINTLYLVSGGGDKMQYS